MTTETERTPAKPPQTGDLSHQHEAIRKEVRSWAITLLIFGVLHVIASGHLNAPFGVMLVIVGLASFYFRSASMLVVYAVTLAWAGISNLTTGEWIWMGFAVMQGYFCFRILRRFSSYRQAEQAVEAPKMSLPVASPPSARPRCFPGRRSSWEPCRFSPLWVSSGRHWSSPLYHQTVRRPSS